MKWNLKAPSPAKINDSEVISKSSKLSGKNICLLVCGSIAAYRTPDLVREIRRHGGSVTVVLSKDAQNFVTPMTLEWCSGNKVICDLSADAEHLAGDKNYDIYLVAPASYNTINKFATGIADSPVTITLSSALGQLENGTTKIFLSPCMHGSMHNSILVDSMKKLQKLGVTILKPRQEDGKNKLPEISEIVEAICLKN